MKHFHQSPFRARALHCLGLQWVDRSRGEIISLAFNFEKIGSRIADIEASTHPFGDRSWF